MSIHEWDPSAREAILRFMEQNIPFNKVLGLSVSELREGFCRMEIPFREELIGDPFRPALHGGVLSALADTCGGAAVFTLVSPLDKVATIDLRVDYLRPGRLTTVVCEGTALRVGSRVASVDMRLFHPDAPGDLIATGKGVYHVKRGEPGKP
jgi:uncharacterized protein (TIGR00369 family)